MVLRREARKRVLSPLTTPRLLPHILFFMWWLHVSSTTAPRSCAEARSLSPELSAWNHVPGFEGKARIWDRPLLDGAIDHLGSPALVLALLNKLESGRPIVAVRTCK